MNILIDNWKENINSSKIFEVENFEEVKSLILKLNEKEHSQLIMEGKESYLLIGGGNKRFVVSLVVGEDEKFFELINIKQKDNYIEDDLVTGGQLGCYSKRYINGLEDVLKASKYYLNFETINLNLLWEEN